MSPPASLQYPPQKRQRLSPADSPYTSPRMSNSQLPGDVSSQSFSQSTFGVGASGAVERDQPSTPVGGPMGPPSRPVEEKAPGIDDLSDVLYGSGIDIREEESALLNRGVRNTPISSSFVGSFEGSQSTTYDGHLFPHYSSNVPGGRDSFYGAGVFNQSPLHPDVVQQQAKDAKRERIRQVNIRRQWESSDPFLSVAAMDKKLRHQTTLSQIRMPSQAGGLPQQQTYRQDSFTLGSPNTNAVRPLGEVQTLISSECTAHDVLTLISLAARERVRTLIEDTGAVARGRRETAHGLVPPELADISVGVGKSTEALYGDPSRGNPLKRKYALPF